MKKYKQLIAIIMIIVLMLSIAHPALATGTTVNESSENLSREQLLQLYYSNKKAMQMRSEAVPSQNYDLLDEINNNPIENVVTEDNAESEVTLQSNNYDMSLMSEVATTSNAFKVDPVNKPFYASSNNNESVSLATGALNYTKTLMALPGRNGLDLNISINYNSQDAVITKNEFDCTRSEIQRINPNNFAIGWSFGFSTIIKENEKHLYGYDTKTMLRFSDGSSYEIENDDDESTEEIQLSLKNYKYDDISLVRNYHHGAYILKYSNGITEYFDTTYGCITRREDRFGNYIEFQYEDIEYFQGSLTDYIFDPNIYVAKFHALKRIVDSVGRIIDVDYVINKTFRGTLISKLKFIVNDINYATINLNQSEGYNGNVIVISSVVDAEGLRTQYEYEEKITHIQNDDTTYSVLGSNFVLKKITYPTGEMSIYEYTKDRRSYYIPETYSNYWYNVYKVSSSAGSWNESCVYTYQSDMSGYPYSYLTEDTGYVNNEKHEYYTMVEKNAEATTVYTFNYKHEKINEVSFDSYGDYKPYVNSGGYARHTVSLDDVYRVDSIDNMIYIYRQGNSDFENQADFYKPYVSEEYVSIMSVNTRCDKIYVFYKTGSGTVDSPYVFHSLIFDTSTEMWEKEDYYTLDETDVYYYFFDKMYYTNNTFYSLYKLNDKYHYLTYTINDTGYGDWRYYSIDIGEYKNYDFEYLCCDSGTLYYKYGHNIYSQIVNSSYIQKKYYIIGLNSDKKYGGFCLDGDLFVYTDENMYKVNLTTSDIAEVIKYKYPIEMKSSSIMQKSSDGMLCYISKCDDDNSIHIYQFNPAKEPYWVSVGRRLFNNENSDLIMLDGYACFSTGSINSYYGGYEYVYMTTNTQTYPYATGAEYSYNSYNQLTKKRKTAYSTSDKRIANIGEYEYVNGMNLLSSATDALGNITTYDYSDSPYGIPVTITQYAGTDDQLITTNVLSDDKTKILSSTTVYDDRNITVAYTYDTTYVGNVLSETTSEFKDGAETILSNVEYKYDSNGANVVQITQKDVITNNSDFNTGSAMDISVSYTYDYMGQILSETDAYGNITKYEYNNSGWLIKTTYPDNTFVEKSYVINDGNIKVTTSHNNEYITVDYYDAFGRINKNCIMNGITEIMQAEYFFSGNNIIATDYPNGNTIFYYYDYMGRPSWTQNYDSVNGWNSYNSYWLNDYENTKTVTYGGLTNKTYYDDAGRVIKQEQNNSAGCNTTLYEYDNRSNVIKTTDGLGRIITNTYNDLNQLLSSTNQIGQTTTYEYDIRNNLTNVTYHNNNTMDYTYDSMSRLLTATDVLGNTEYYAYDKNNNLINYKDKNGNITTNSYDIMNRLTNAATGDINTSYTYDNLGNIDTMTDSTGTTSYSYDYAMNVASITTPDNESITYSYDDIGNIVGMVDYAGNEYAYTYDIKYRLSQINLNNTMVAQYKYTDFDYIESVIYPDYTESYQYDAAAIITSKSIVSASDSIEYSYVYDLVGNQLKKTETYNGTETVTDYTYDALSRLTSVQEHDGTKTSYAFDAGNNIMTKSITHPSSYEFSFKQDGAEHTINNISTHNYTYTYDKANRLMSTTESIAGTGDTYSGYLEIVNNYTYDNNGNTLSKTISGQVDESVVQYGYNPLNQLVSFTAADGTVTGYEYDGTGMRVSKTQGNVTHKFYWDRGYIVNEGDNNDITVTNYVGLQGVFARKTNHETDYLLKNGHGDTTYRLNGESIENNYIYDAFGAVTNDDEQDTNPFRYCGEYYDNESGLIYLRNRYYDPSMGRFITEDPVKDGNNWYAYCGNNPIRYIDPTGYITDEEIAMYERGEMAPSAYKHLMALTYEWYLAHTDEERDKYHKLAEDFRDNNYLTTDGEFPDIDVGIEYMPERPGEDITVDEHYFRNELNIQYGWDEFQELQQELPEELQWKELEPDESRFHQIGQPDNRKYVSACEHFEVVYTKENDLVNEGFSEMNMGTYNYYGLSQRDLHKTVDVYPYLKWGNTPKGWIWTGVFK